ncbi:MAG: DNA recombination protein RmuC [Alphaproteobacteria bacterium]
MVMNAMIYAVIGLGVALFAAVIRVVQLSARIRAEEAAAARSRDHFEVTAQEVIRNAHESFLQLAEGRLKEAHKDSAHDLEKRQKAVAELVDPIGKTLKEMEAKIENLGKAGVGLETQLKTFSEIQNRLHSETTNLSRALRNPGQGGRWGEMHLQRTLEFMGMVENTHFRRQVYTSVDGAGQQPDFILDMPSGLHIVVDVKTPMDPYLELTGTDLGDEQRAAALGRLQKAFRSHLADLSRKEYWQRFNSPDFVVMYLPSEGLFSMAVGADPTLLEEAANKRIIIASPTTFMGLARIAHYGWQQKNIAEEAQKIADLGAMLYERVVKFGEHMQKLGGSLNSAVKTYNFAIGSLESKLLTGAKKFKDLHIGTSGREIPDLEAIEEMPREIAAPELLEQQKKRA